MERLNDGDVDGGDPVPEGHPAPPGSANLPKGVDTPRGSRWDSITLSIGLFLSLPFAISATVTFVLGFITQVEMAAGRIKQPWESSWGGWAELFGIVAGASFFLGLLGTIFVVAVFQRRRTPLRWIAVVVAAVPWFLIGAYIIYEIGGLFLLACTALGVWLAINFRRRGGTSAT